MPQFAVSFFFSNIFFLVTIFTISVFVYIKYGCTSNGVISKVLSKYMLVFKRKFSCLSVNYNWYFTLPRTGTRLAMGKNIQIKNQCYGRDYLLLSPIRFYSSKVNVFYYINTKFIYLCLVLQVLESFKWLKKLIQKKYFETKVFIKLHYINIKIKRDTNIKHFLVLSSSSTWLTYNTSLYYIFIFLFCILFLFILVRMYTNRLNALLWLLALEAFVLLGFLSWCLHSSMLDDIVGQCIAFLILVLAAGEGCLGLGFLIVWYRRYNSVVMFGPRR